MRDVVRQLVAGASTVSAKRLLVIVCAAAIASVYVAWPHPVVRLGAQAPQNANVPKIPFDTSADFLRVLARYEPRRGARGRRQFQRADCRAEPSGQRDVWDRSTATRRRSCFEFDQNGKFVREIGRGVYGLGYAHSVRFDKATTTSGSSTKASIRSSGSTRPGT